MTDPIIGSPTCPACGALLDGATDVEQNDAVPQPGDVTTCAYCAAWLVFTLASGRSGLALRYPTDEELTVLVADPRMVLARTVVLERIRRYG